MTYNEDGSSTFAVYSNVVQPDVVVYALPAGSEMSYEAWDHYRMQHRAALVYPEPVTMIPDRYVSTDSTDFDELFPMLCRVEVVRTEITNYAVIQWQDALDGDTYASCRFRLIGDDAEQDEPNWNGIGWNGIYGLISQTFCFAADSIGDSITVELVRTMHGETQVTEQDGWIIETHEAIAQDTARHTFHLIPASDELSANAP